MATSTGPAAPERPTDVPRSAGSSRSLDAAVALWVALWLVLGTWTAVEVWRLADLTRTVAGSGIALDEAGRALEALGQVPVVGDESAELGGQVRANARDIVAGAEDARGSMRRLSVLLGLATAFVPTVPVVVMHRVLRRRRAG